MRRLWILAMPWCLGWAGCSEANLPKETSATASPEEIRAADSEPTPTPAVAPPAKTSATEPGLGQDKRADSADACAKICEITRALGCPRDQSAQCAAACAQMHDSEACAEEMRAFLRCAAAQDASHWHCGEDGESALRGEECDAEQLGVVLCLEKIGG